MARDYTLDTKAAADANNGGKRIKDAGPYIGLIKQAWSETNEKGTESVVIDFVSESGQQALLPLYTHNGSGEVLPSFKTLNAIMCCVKLRELKASKGNVTVYDFDAKVDVQRQKEVYKDLMGKKIGLLLQREEYEGQNGIKERMNVFGVYEAATRLTANEILERSTEPHALDRMEKFLADNPLRALKRGGSSRPAQQSSATPANNDLDDEIPF